MQQDTFIKTSTKLAQSTKLNSTQKLFISYILGWQDNNKVCFASNNQIAFELGLEYEGVRSVINRLNKPEFGFFNVSKTTFTTEYNNVVSKHELRIDEIKLNEFLESSSIETKPKVKKTVSKKSKPVITEEVKPVEEIEEVILIEEISLVEEGLEVIENKSQSLTDFNFKSYLKSQAHKNFDLIEQYDVEILFHQLNFTPHEDFYDHLASTDTLPCKAGSQQFIEFVNESFAEYNLNQVEIN